MNDTRPRIPIPKDIERGDVLVLRDGRRRKWLEWNEEGDSVCEGALPGGHYRNGSWWSRERKPHWDVVAIERKAKPKPPRDDKDAAWLMRVFDWKNADCDSSRRMVVRLAPIQIGRLRAIARRCNGGKAVARA